jgi:tetratricopeptide (TPR) repeat protein
MSAKLNRAKHDLTLVMVIVVGLALVLFLSRTLDSRRPPVNLAQEEEKLYLSGNAAKRLSLGFNGLIADWYWMRSLQYVGGKMLKDPSRTLMDSLSDLNLKLLAPLLDTATTLDPTFIEPYEYAAIVLPAVDVDAAIRLTKKGIAANPSSWRLHQHLGYVYWQLGEFHTAAEIYGTGSKIPGAPQWMEAMEAKMAAEGGSRNTAREIYTRMYEESSDTKVKDMAEIRLKQLDSLDQRDAVRKVLTSYMNKRNACPTTWKEIAPILQSLGFALDSQGAPLDPVGHSYRLITANGSCDIDLDPASPIPRK